VAVGRHLAEATWWVLVKGELYRDPAIKFRKEGRRGNLHMGYEAPRKWLPNALGKTLCRRDGEEMCPAGTG